MKRPILGLLLGFVVTAVLAQAPTIDPKDDHKHMPPEGASILFLTPHQRVATFRNVHLTGPVRKITAGGEVLALPEDTTDLGDVQITDGERTLTVNDYFNTQSVGGLLVLKDGEVIYERYGLGNTEDTLWISFSVAKSVVSMLVGAAIKDGYIKSLDEKVTDYLPRLKNSSYDQSSIRDVLQMSSGVSWNENYADRNSDVNQATWGTTALYEYLRELPRLGMSSTTIPLRPTLRVRC